MYKKGQIGFGYIVIAAVAVLIGLAFYTGIFAENIGTLTKTSASYNQTMTLPAVTATSELTMCGQKALTNILTNSTNGSQIVPTTNYTITQSAGTDGYLAAKITTASQSAYAGRSINVSCTFEPKGYITDGGSRGIVGLIAIFMALLIVIAAMPNIRDKLFDVIKK